MAFALGSRKTRFGRYPARAADPTPRAAGTGGVFRPADNPIRRAARAHRQTVTVSKSNRGGRDSR